MPLPKGLASRVKAYLAKNIYSGFKKPFELERLTPGPNTQDRVWVVPRDVACEIQEPDRRWEKGLAKLGERLGIELEIDPFAYV